MTAKTYLSKIRKTDTIINSKLQEIDGLYAMITKITPTLKADVVSGGGNQDKIGDAVARIVDLQKEINADVDKLVDQKREAAALLEKLENPQHYEVLHKRYVQYMTFEAIAVDMAYTYRGVCYLHGRALAEFEKIMTGNADE